MRFRLLIILLCCCAGGLMAQAPGTFERRDIDGDYRRPDLQAPLFDAAALPLPPEQIENVMQDLRLIARNLPDSTAVDHRLRSHALAVALRLQPDDRASVVANGQFARGVRPAPLPVEITATPEGIAQRLADTAMSLLHAPEKAARDFALLLLDLAQHLNSRLRPQISLLTYGAAPDWHEAGASVPPLESAPSFRLLNADVRVLLPGLNDGQLRILTVQALARPAPGHRGLRVILPEPVRMEMKGRKPFRQDIEQRMAGMRAALRLRHEVWPEGWSVEFSYSGTKDIALPQLFAGIALTLESLLGDAKTDPRCVIAAGVDPAGKLQRVLPVEELLPAAALQQSSAMLLLPPGAEEQLNDWVLLHPDQWPLLYHLSLHRVPDLADAMALLKSKRAPLLEQSVSLFSMVSARLRAAPDPLAELRRPETIRQLREITTWHPQHLSASALLGIATGGPLTLTVRGSLAHIDRVARSVLSTDRKLYPLHLPRPRFEKSIFRNDGDALAAAKNQLHPAVHAYAAEVMSLARMLDRAVGNWSAYRKDNGPPDPPAVTQQRAKAAALRAELQTRVP
jgi:hypothetical protein